MKRAIGTGLLLLGVAAGIALAGAQLVLTDGRSVEGEEVRREGDQYVVTLPSGDAVVIPTPLVREVRLSAPPGGPSGIKLAEPETLAGDTVHFPTTEEQTAAFAGAARFQPDIVDSRWEPSSDWDVDHPERDNNFRPSHWRENIVSSDWTPHPAFAADADALAAGRSTWAPSVVQNEWKPTDGFARR